MSENKKHIKFEEIVNNINNTIIEFDKEQEIEIIKQKHIEYQDQFIVFGKDYFDGHNVWFIKAIADSELTRLKLEQIVLNYLSKKCD